MDYNEIDSKINKLEKEVRDKSSKRNILWLQSQYKGEDELVEAKTYYENASKEKDLFKLSSGLKGLDKIIGGFKPGNLVIISGPTKQGKTTFCQTLTINFSKQKYSALWFSFDTPPLQLIERFGKDLPEFYLPLRNSIDKKIDWIESKIIEGIAKYNTRIIFIDHLESISKYSNNAPNYSTELQSISRELKEIAIRWNSIIFLNHHIKSIGAEETPNWTHLKNSSGPAQESDLTIMVWRDRMKAEFGEIIYADTGNISVQLNRDTGKTGIIKVVWKNNLFIENGKAESNERIF